MSPSLPFRIRRVGSSAHSPKRECALPPAIVFGLLVLILLAGVSLLDPAHAQYTEQTGSNNPFDGVTVTATPAALDAVAGDFDSDGDLDLLAYDGVTERFFSNNGIGAFTEQTGNENPFDGLSGAFGTRGRTFVRDVDGDDDLDLVVFDYAGGGTGTLVFVENTDGSTYARQTGADNPFDGISVSGNQATVDAVMGDFGGTPAPDLLVYDGSSERYYENDGTGTFTEQTGSDNPFNGLSQAFATNTTTLVRDVDGDGDVDLAFRDGTGGATAWRYREHTGSGYVARTGADNPLSDVAADATAKSVAITTADFDLDGHLDLLTYDNGTQRYYDGDGSGTFSEQTGGANPFDGTAPALQTAATTIAADPDRDRDPDVTFADAGAGATVLHFVERVNAGIAFTDGRNDGNGGQDYTPPAPTPGTDANPVGRFSLQSLDPSGAALEAVTVSLNGPASQGIDAVELWRSNDNAFEAGADTRLSGEQSAASTVTFSDLASAIGTSEQHLFVVVDLADGARGDVAPFLADEASLSFSGGDLSQVNGTAQSTIDQRAYLSTSSTALPVELASFDGRATPDGVALEWQTASEQNNAGFRVQRRAADAGRWTTLGRKDGQGTTTQPHEYRFADTEVPYEADSLTYRLKQIDTDGSTAYSAPITVARSAVTQVELLGTYPNPARTRATVRFAVPEGQAQAVTLRLYDVLGRAVRTVRSTAEPGRHSVALDTQGLTSGVYFLRLRAGDATKTQRLTVVQ